MFLEGQQHCRLHFFSARSRDQLLWSALRLFSTQLHQTPPKLQNIDSMALNRKARARGWGKAHELLRFSAEEEQAQHESSSKAREKMGMGMGLERDVAAAILKEEQKKGLGKG